MTNNKKRRIRKEAERRARVKEIDQMREMQERVKSQRTRQQSPSTPTGCQKRRRRKHRPQGVKLMQSKKGLLRPYYRQEHEALARGER